MNNAIKIKCRYLSVFTIVFSFVFAVCLIVFSNTAKDGAAAGLIICRDVILTNVFPFSVAANLLIASGATDISGKLIGKFIGKIFGVSGSGAGIILLGAVGGFPTGAYAASSLYAAGKLDKNEAERLISYTNNPTPAFMIGHIGSILGSAGSGVLCYVCALFSSFLWGILIRRRRGENAGKTDAAAGGFSFSSAVTKSASSTIAICGFVIVFSVISNIATRFISNGFACALICSVFEITTGVASVSALYLPARTAAAVLCAVCSFSGICIFSQVKTEADSAGLSVKYYIYGKIFQAAVSFFAVYALYPLIFS